MDASIIIPTYKRWDHLKTCLDCLSKQTILQNRFEIIVVNNDPEDLPPQELELPVNARMITESKPGSYAARNAGIFAARSDLLFFVDSDCRPARDFLAAGLKAAAANPDVMRFAGNISLFSQSANWNAAEYFDRLGSLRQSLYAQNGWAATANMFARKQAFDTVGLFDSSVYSGGDREWGFRAQDQGLEILFVPDAVVGHPTRSTFIEIARKNRRRLGAQMQKQKQHSIVAMIRPIRRIFPAVGMFTRALRDPGISFGQALKIYGFSYALRLSVMIEEFRLLWTPGDYERE